VIRDFLPTAYAVDYEDGRRMLPQHKFIAFANYDLGACFISIAMKPAGNEYKLLA